jgi:hypothetical protein
MRSTNSRGGTMSLCVHDEANRKFLFNSCDWSTG